MQGGRSTGRKLIVLKVQYNRQSFNDSNAYFSIEFIKITQHFNIINTNNTTLYIWKIFCNKSNL